MDTPAECDINSHNIVLGDVAMQQSAGLSSREDEPATSWAFLCNVADLLDVDGLRVVIADHAYAVFKVDDRFFVTDDTCTHGAASLSDGMLRGCEIECPFHGGRFDIATGVATAFPCTEDLATYAAEVRGNSVYAKIKV
jgi:nitrite reductase/ring-hydroxylating ferredoxin subunit